MKSILITFFLSMVPIIELRGALPVGVASGLSPETALIVSILGNMVPVPFIVIFIRKIFILLRQRSDFWDRIVSKMEEKAEKNSEKVHKYEMIGLFLLVAIPLPGTGAWTGSLVAAFLDMRLKRCFPAIFLGVVTAGIIVYAITYGFTSILL